MLLLRRLGIFVLFGVLIAGTIVARFGSGKPYPACDNSAARAELAVLYDNRRLLHAVEVSNFRLVKDGFKGRDCAVTVQWGDGSESDVHFQFSRPGRRSQVVRMWIDYNGGMSGPSF